MKKLWEEFQYFFQQKIYVIILCLTAICGYGFEMTHPSIGIDDTAGSRSFAGKMVHLSDK